MPPAEEVMAAYRQVGSVSGLADHFGVPRYTVQGWARQLRKQGYAIGRVKLNPHRKVSPTPARPGQGGYLYRLDERTPDPGGRGSSRRHRRSPSHLLVVPLIYLPLAAGRVPAR